MIGYTTLGVNDLDAAKKFYTELFDAEILVDAGRIVMIGKAMGEPMISVCTPYKEGAAALYNKAIALGATCDGEPGQRVPNRFYGAYVKDPDGNKLCFFDFS